MKQKLGLFDFLTPNECRALIVAVEQLQEELRDAIYLTIALQQRIPEDERSLAEGERIDDACSIPCHGDILSAKLAMKSTARS